MSLNHAKEINNSQPEPKDFPVWRTITVGIDDKKTVSKKLKKGNFLIPDCAQESLRQTDYIIATEEAELELINISIIDMGYKFSALLEEIHDKIVRLGFGLASMEASLQLRIQYSDQPRSECLSVPTMPIKDPGSNFLTFELTRYAAGVPHLFLVPEKPRRRYFFSERLIFVRRKVIKT